MLSDGTYAAWYKTGVDQGTGIVHVADGQIWGCDSLMTYHGRCKVEGDRFTAIVETKRHTDGRATVFGTDDELTLHIEGTCPNRIATYTATADQAPGLVLHGTLIPSQQQLSAAGEQLFPRPDIEGLPKLRKRLR